MGCASSRSRVGFSVEALKQLAQVATASSARGAAVGTRMVPPCCCARTASERESLVKTYVSTTPFSVLLYLLLLFPDCVGE